MFASAPLLPAVAAVLLIATVGDGAHTKLTQGAPSLWTIMDPFSIPTGQCSRDLADVLVCDGGMPPDGAEVTVDDRTPFPHVTISADFRRGRVTRVEPCAGEAYVVIKKSC